MGSFVDRIQALALALGAPGLFIASFLDSSFLSLPEVNDLLLIWMVTEHKGRMVLYVASATIGSIAGCLVLYLIGKKGGDAMIRRRFAPERVDKGLAAFQRYGIMAILIPSILPPPAPFKIFILLAGVADIGISRFVVAVALGRGIRYFAEGILAVRYGDAALEFVRANGKGISLAVSVLLLAGFAGYVLWSKAQARRAG